MPRIRRPGEDPVFKPDRPNRSNNNGGGGGGKKKNKNKGQGGTAGTPGGDASTATTPGTTTAFAIQDPAAWMRSNMVAAGMPVNDATAYGRFQQDAIVSPFVAGWQEWKASHPTTSDQDFWNYARGTGMGLPDAVTGGPPAAPGAPGTTAGDPMAFNAFVKQETGKGKGQLNQGRRQRLRTSYDDYVAQQQTVTNPTPQVNPATLGPVDFAAFNAWAQNERDKYTLQQQGRFDAGKQPGSIRINLFN